MYTNPELMLDNLHNYQADHLAAAEKSRLLASARQARRSRRHHRSAGGTAVSLDPCVDGTVPAR
ncbi:MAG TPA: hypothetical protein VGN37_31810 [Actinocatenispora sp.]